VEDHAVLTTNAHFLERQAAVESNARTYPRKLPLAIRSAQGLYVTDVEGRTYLDCLCGAGTLALGHNHPVVIEAIQTHLAAGYPLHTLDLTTPVKDEFVSELLGSLPPEFADHARIQFCSPSGADAVEAALKIVKTATGRRGMLAFQGAFHGQTHGALALMGSWGPKQHVQNLMADVHFLPYPYAYRCPLGHHGHGCHDCTCADYIENLLSNPEGGVMDIAGMILEVVQGEGGAIPAPEDFLGRLRGITADHDIPLIFDEVQTGWGRTGKLYAFEHSGVIPDVLVLSKAIGGGLPLAVVVYHERLDAWQPGAHSGTFRGNQLAMAAGLATLRFIQSEGIADHAAQMGDYLRRYFNDFQNRYAFVGQVRNKGLMMGIEIVNPDQRNRLGRMVGDGQLARRIQSECFKHGLIHELGGQHGAVMRLLPPLTLTYAEADRICGIIGEVFEGLAL
jgi:diaminobutyrate-2-oxoglutarate transaminase